MKYCRGCMESMRFYLVHMVSVLALVRPESEFITAYQKVSRSHMPDECLFSSSSSVHTLYMSRSGTQLSMHYFWEKEAVSSHVKVILQLKSCIRTDLISRLCHVCLSLSLYLLTDGSGHGDWEKSYDAPAQILSLPLLAE